MTHWALRCSGCGSLRGVFPQRSRPTLPPWDCDDCGAPGSMSHWEPREVAVPLIGRASGFSHSESDFTPHYNHAFGREIHSLAQLRALQKRHGLQDADLATMPTPPRDLDRRVARREALADAASRPGGAEVARGVRATLTDPGE